MFIGFIVVFLLWCNLYLLLRRTYTTPIAFGLYFKDPSSSFGLATSYSIWEQKNFSQQWLGSKLYKTYWPQPSAINDISQIVIYIYIISKSWNMTFIIDTLLLSHIGIAFQSTLVHCDSFLYFGPFGPLQSNLATLVYFGLFRSNSTTLVYFSLLQPLWSSLAHSIHASDTLDWGVCYVIKVLYFSFPPFVSCVGQFCPVFQLCEGKGPTQYPMWGETNIRGHPAEEWIKLPSEDRWNMFVRNW